MENLSNTVKGIVTSPAVRAKGKDFWENLIGVFTKDPSVILHLREYFKSSVLSVRDEIFLESLETYIMGVYRYNEEKKQFETENLCSLAVTLAEASPNYEADYSGSEDRLVEYAKRIIKLLDDCGTKQKACYLVNLTRALTNNKQIDTQKFFQLSRCIRNLTEEDLFFLGENIKEGIISGDKDYIDDYRALGLLLETDGGFAYTKRAFELKKYALKYEQQVEIPQQIPERLSPISHGEFSLEDVKETVNASKWDEF